MALLSYYFSLAVLVLAVFVSWKMPGSWFTPTWLLVPAIAFLLALEILDEPDPVRIWLRIGAVASIAVHLILRQRLTNWFLTLSFDDVENLRVKLKLQRQSRCSSLVEREKNNLKE